MNSNGFERETAMRHLERVLASTPFRQAERSAGLLRYLVQRSLEGAGDRLKEYTVGVEALGRGKEFDPRTDPIVRAEASRLRSRLDRYYAGEGQSDVVVIELPKGGYTARFVARPMPPTELAAETPAPRQIRSYRRPMLWAAFGALSLVGAFSAGAWIARSFSTDREPTMRLEVKIQSGGQTGSDVGTDVVLAPDGSKYVFVSIDSLGVSRLRLGRLDGSPPMDLPGTTGGRGAFWAPDSRWIGFWAARQLRKIAVDGGSPVVLCDASDLLGASWGADGTIIAALDATKRLWRVDASSSGTPVAIALAADDAALRWPQILPDGKHVLYTALAGVSADQAAIEVVSLTDGKRKRLVEGGTFGRFLAPNHLTFVNQGTLYAMRFDPASLETRGPRVPILDSVSYSTQFGYAQITIAETGVAIYRRVPPPLIVARVDSAGRQTPLLEAPGQYAFPALSPDGKHLAVSVIESGVPSISIYTNTNERWHFERRVPGYDAAVWTRDGQYIVARGSRGIAWMRPVGGEPRNLIERESPTVPWTFAPDDRRLAFAAMDPATAFDLWTAPIEKTGDTLRAGTPTAIVRTRAFEVYPAISPDGGWLAYATDKSGSPEVFVRSLADTSIEVPIGRGRVPRWSKAGQRLFFSTADQRIVMVTYTTARGRFVPGTRRQWTRIRLADTGVLPNYDLGADDKYIVALLPAPSAEVQEVNHVTLIYSFSDEVRRKAP